METATEFFIMIVYLALAIHYADEAGAILVKLLS